MGGFIILDDGRAYAPANWAFRATVEAITEALPDTFEGQALAEWLRKDPIVQVYYNIDVRELTSANREMILKAIEDASVSLRERGPAGWENVEMWRGWMDGFAVLLKMIGCVRRGEPASDFNPHMTDTIPPTGERVGPGW